MDYKEVIKNNERKNITASYSKVQKEVVKVSRVKTQKYHR